MSQKFPDSTCERSIEMLRKCSIPIGFVASAEQSENYHRVWSRDAVIAGVASLLSGDATLIHTFHQSLLTLAKHQAPMGQLPSNVSSDGGVSYGSLAGRVDATTWWIVGWCLYVKQFPDASDQPEMRFVVEKAFHVLQAWEFNERGLLYTPLGGNWADEYISQGYVLYDQLLYYWALKLAGEVYDHPEWKSKSIRLKNQINLNFGGLMDSSLDRPVHPRAFEQFQNTAPAYWPFSFSPAGYDGRWDMAAHALALILDFPLPMQGIKAFIEKMKVEYHHAMIPVFYPVIMPESVEWNLLRDQFNYEFKNQPHHFHNGGSWPVFQGWLVAGLAYRGEEQLAKELADDLMKALFFTEDSIHFHEYFNPVTLQAGGKSSMAFSASGVIMALAGIGHPSIKSIKQLQS